MASNSRASRIRRFVAAGLASIAGGVVDIAVLVALVETGTQVAVAAFAAAACGAIGHFVACKYVAFRDRSRVALGQVLRFAVVALGTALLMAVAMQLFAVELHVPYLVAKLGCSILIFAVWTYPAQRYFVFVGANVTGF